MPKSEAAPASRALQKGEQRGGAGLGRRALPEHAAPLGEDAADVAVPADAQAPAVLLLARRHLLVVGVAEAHDAAAAAREHRRVLAARLSAPGAAAARVVHEEREVLLELVQCRGLLSYRQGEPRHVQSGVDLPTVEGNLQPHHGLVVQCGGGRSVVRADLRGEDDAHAPRGVGLHVRNAQRAREAVVRAEVDEGLVVLAKPRLIVTLRYLSESVQSLEHFCCRASSAFAPVCCALPLCKIGA
jgi:hypothetical protein